MTRKYRQSAAILLLPALLAWMMSAGLLAGGCPANVPFDSLGRLGASPSESDGDPTRAASAFVGKLANTRASIGLVSDGEEVLAYVCDGDEGEESFSQWFAGRIEDGAFTLRGVSDSPDPGPYGSEYAASSLTGRIRDGAADGWLVLDNGRWFDWTAAPVDPQTAAGLYARTTEDLLAGVVITNDNRAIGLAGFREPAIRREVFVPEPRPGAARQQAQALDPRDILLRFEVQRVTTPDRGQVRSRPRPQQDEPEPVRDIEVKFRDSFIVRLRLDPDSDQFRPQGLIPRDGDERDAALTSDDARALLHDLSRGTWERLCLGTPEEKIDDLREQAIAALAERPPARIPEVVPDMNNWFWYRVPEELDPDVVLARLRRLPEVEYAGPMPQEVVPANLPPDMTVDPNPSGVYQAYLDPADVGGIDARYAWTLPGGAGQGVTVCSVEYDANRFHLDLMLGGPDLVQRWGDTPQYSDGNFREHGTGVLGIIGARDNNFGITGIAHEAMLAYVPVATQATNGKANIANAIMLATVHLALGDVMVIEQQVAGPNRFVGDDDDQTGLVPAEWNRAAFDAIRLATIAGRIVVECAGNGRTHLELNVFTDPEINSGHHPFAVSASGAPLLDSGAILVGAGISPLFRDSTGVGGYERRHNGTSNFGRRIDVQSWGDNILSLGNRIAGTAPFYAGPPITFYTLFAGTSGAGAMVAGMAASLQGIAKQDLGRPLRPEEMRDLLKAASLPQVIPTPPGSLIGRMPTLRAAIDVLRGPLTPPVFDPLPDASDPEISPATPQVVTINVDPTLNPAYFRIAYTTDGSRPDVFPLDQPLLPGGSIRFIDPGETVTLTQRGLLRAVAFMQTRALGGVFDDRGMMSTETSAYYGLHVPPPTVNIAGGSYPGILYVTLHHNLGDDFYFYQRQNFRAGSFYIIYTLDGSEPDRGLIDGLIPGTPSHIMNAAPTETFRDSTYAFGFHYWYPADGAPLEMRIPISSAVEVFRDSPNVILNARTAVGLGFGVGTNHLAPAHFAWSDLRTEHYVQQIP